MEYQTKQIREFFNDSNCAFARLMGEYAAERAATAKLVADAVLAQIEQDGGYGERDPANAQELIDKLTDAPDETMAKLKKALHKVPELYACVDKFNTVWPSLSFKAYTERHHKYCTLERAGIDTMLWLRRTGWSCDNEIDEIRKLQEQRGKGEKGKNDFIKEMRLKGCVARLERLTAPLRECTHGAMYAIDLQDTAINCLDLSQAYAPEAKGFLRAAQILIDEGGTKHKGRYAIHCALEDIMSAAERIEQEVDVSIMGDDGAWHRK